MSADIKQYLPTPGGQDTTSTSTPRMIDDPFAGDWPSEPHVSEAERMLYGRYAGVVRLLGHAAVSAEQAYSLACKHASEVEDVFEDNTAKVEADKKVNQAWNLYSEAHRVYANTAMAAARDNDARFRGNTPGQTS